MNIVIIEDEQLAAERLQILLRDYDPSIKVIACLESIREAVSWLNDHMLPDLLLVDIQLSDGFSFEIFRRKNLMVPVIFTTAFDQYALDAFKVFSIDYILKPVTLTALSGAIQKYRAVANALPLPDYNRFAEKLKEQMQPAFKNRFLAKIGQRSYFISTDDVAYFKAEDKIIHLVNRQNENFIINFTMEKLETLLDPMHFFRINRTIIVHDKMIKNVKPYYNSRLSISLCDIYPGPELVVSRDRVAAFKKWGEN